MRVVGDGQNRVDITHVRNAARAHLQAMDALKRGVACGKAYFLSQGEPVALWDWIEALLARLEIPGLGKQINFARAYQLGAVAEAVWRCLRLKGEPPMTRFVATELAKSHWFDITAARRDLAYDPSLNPTDLGVEAYVQSLLK